MKSKNDEHMNIVSPLKRIQEVAPLIKAGAKEIYCGVFTEKQRKKYTNMGCLNRRATTVANLNSFNELKEIVKLAHSYNVSVNFTLNERYSNGQFSEVILQADKAVKSGVDALIVADIGLLYMLNDKKFSNINIHISSLNTTLNSEAVNFYKKLKVSRIILPRQLTISEIKQIIQQIPDIELEVAVLNKRCRFVEGLCSFQHGLSETQCSWLFKLQNINAIERITQFLPQFIKDIYRKHFFQHEFDCYSIYNALASTGLSREKSESSNCTDVNSKSDIKNILNVNGCALCTLYELNKLGIKFIKIIGRGNLLNKKIVDVKFINACISLIKENLEKIDFQQKVKALYKDTYFSKCRQEYCYYPDDIV